MNLLYTLTTYPPSTGGAQLHQHTLAQYMQERHDVHVVTHWAQNRTDWLLGTTLRAPAKRHAYVVDDIPVQQIGLSAWEKAALAPFVATYYPLMKYAIPPIAMCFERQLMDSARSADLIHNVRIGREPLSYASLGIARRRNIPFVLTPVHHPRWAGWRYRAYNELYRQADLLVALTHAEKQILVGLGVRPDRVVVTGTGPILAPQAQPEAFTETYAIDSPIVLFLGQHYQYKGYRQILEAAQQVWQTVPEAQFVFIGPAVGPSEKIFSEVTDRRIHRLGHVDVQTKTNALAACALLCVPSLQESFGLVYTEAWSFGKPVIGCNIPAIAEIISDGEDGYLVAQDATQIADRIVYLLQHTHVAERMGQAGQRKVNAKYTWRSIAEQTERAYDRVVGNGHS